MFSIEAYSAGVFLIILVSGCVINLLERHFIVQLAGLAFLFFCIFIKICSFINTKSDFSLAKLYPLYLPFISGILACLISMFLGFKVFPAVRSKFKR